MIGYIVKRLLWAIPTMLGAITIVFLLLRVMPGDVAVLILTEGAAEHVDPVQLAAVREQLGLNRPLYEQYFSWLWGIVRLDLGTSLWTGAPVWQEIGIRLPYTLMLVVLSVAITVVMAIPIGIISALKQDTWIDYSLRTVAIAGIAIPNFWFGMLLLLFMITVFTWFPPLDYAPIYKQPGIAMQQLMLPAIALGYRSVAVSARMMRSAMLEVMREDYVRTAWAKGLRDRKVIYLHALKNAVLPVITMFGLEAVMIFSGAVIIETIFNIPGIGGLLISGINNRDYILVQGLVTVVVAVVLMVNLLVDLIYAWVDPRIRFRSR
jgi:peptide/nickel transport system permease protein